MDKAITVCENHKDITKHLADPDPNHNKVDHEVWQAAIKKDDETISEMNDVKEFVEKEKE